MYQETDAEDYAKIKDRRRFLRRWYKFKVLLQARASLSYERTLENKWLPRRAVPVTLENVMELPSRWQCDRPFREHAAWLGVHKLVKVHTTVEFIEMKCFNSSCPYVGRFTRHVR